MSLLIKHPTKFIKQIPHIPNFKFLFTCKKCNGHNLYRIPVSEDTCTYADVNTLDTIFLEVCAYCLTPIRFVDDEVYNDKTGHV